jgi:hypothetical protein
MTMNDQVAREVIRERTHPQDAIAAPRHPRTARALRQLADRIDKKT